METDGRLTRTVVQHLQQKFNYFLSLSQPPATAVTMRDFVQWLEILIGVDPQIAGHPEHAEGSLQIVGQARSNPITAIADVAAAHPQRHLARTGLGGSGRGPGPPC
ncbi:MAG: hypothetical protein IPK53_10135 [bacterium]|nr:hypothetical protein [bacterium]